jgi:isoleucyl-tRNA synthetase
MFDKGLLYRGHKVLPYCPQTGTSYSSHEVALGYKEVEEPSVYVKFKLTDDNASILAWTTTPWTLPGNVGLAVGPEVTYVRCRIKEAAGEAWAGAGGADVGEEVILAKDLIKEVLRHHVGWTSLRTLVPRRCPARRFDHGMDGFGGRLGHHHRRYRRGPHRCDVR